MNTIMKSNLNIKKLNMNNVMSYDNFIKESVGSSKEATIKTLRKNLSLDCSYSHMDANGNIVKPGVLLKQYGKHCDYSIRNKEFYVSEDSEGDIVIEWESQGDITSPTPKGCFLDMMENIVFVSLQEDYPVVLKAWERGKGNNRHPQIVAVWDYENDIWIEQ